MQEAENLWSCLLAFLSSIEGEQPSLWVIKAVSLKFSSYELQFPASGKSVSWRYFLRACFHGAGAEPGAQRHRGRQDHMDRSMMNPCGRIFKYALYNVRIFFFKEYDHDRWVSLCLLNHLLNSWNSVTLKNAEGFDIHHFWLREDEFLCGCWQSNGTMFVI